MAGSFWKIPLYAHGRIRMKTAAKNLWLMPVILATPEVEIRRITVQSQPGQIVCKTLSQKQPITEKDWWSGSK
jgi:hypothetical protein